MQAVTITQISPPELEFLIENSLNKILQAQQKQQLGETLLSPAKTCKLFDPEISKVTLTAWTKQGLLNDYRIGGKIFYKYSEIIEAAKHLKRYQAHKAKQHINNK